MPTIRAMDFLNETTEAHVINNWDSSHGHDSPSEDDALIQRGSWDGNVCHRSRHKRIEIAMGICGATPIISYKPMSTFQPVARLSLGSHIQGEWFTLSGQNVSP